MERIQAIKLFVRVVDLGSFSKAAGELGVGHPPPPSRWAGCRRSWVRACCTAAPRA
ncbi:hypothetical protein M2244_003191 [Rhodoferax antarcticus]|nr:hypothetical protein [Rhodoferax antarcticus]